MSLSEQSVSWIKEVISKVFSDGLKLKVDEFRFKITSSTTSFISSVYFLLVKFKNTTTDQSEKLNIVLKKPIQDENHMLETRSNDQFHNEILFYTLYARPEDNFPKCYYTNNEEFMNTIIVLENTNRHGYYACPYMHNAPLEFILAAMREMGRFHGKGYVMKKFHEQEFLGIVEQIRECIYMRDIEDNFFEVMINIIAPRALEYLSSHGYDKEFCQKMKPVFENAFEEIMLDAIRPFEPLATLCHGNFTLSNTLFSKKETDEQCKAMLINFMLMRYATPAIDICTFLCICVSNKTRIEQFSKIMHVYHDSLIKYLQDAGIQDVSAYAYNNFVENYKACALFGFVIASFYLPMLYGYQYNVHSHKKCAKENKILGGEKLTKKLANILVQLREFGCCDQYL